MRKAWDPDGNLDSRCALPVTSMCDGPWKWGVGVHFQPSAVSGRADMLCLINAGVLWHAMWRVCH